jgi:hypothetical protein
MIGLSIDISVKHNSMAVQMMRDIGPPTGESEICWDEVVGRYLAFMHGFGRISDEFQIALYELQYEPEEFFRKLEAHATGPSRFFQAEFDELNEDPAAYWEKLKAIDRALPYIVVAYLSGLDEEGWGELIGTAGFAYVSGKEFQYLAEYFPALQEYAAVSSRERAAKLSDDPWAYQRGSREPFRLDSVTARVMAKLWRYPRVTDLRTGRPIRFPTNSLQIVPREQRVLWGANERAAFIKEWHERGYPRPPGGWDKYDIHHIQPRELGGTNDFWNLTPVERETHQSLFNAFWREFVE